MGFPCGCLARCSGRMVGVSTFRNDDTGCLGSVSSPVDLLTLCIELKTIHPYHLPFWPKPISNFGLFCVTGFINSSLMLTMHPRLVPYRVLLSDMPFASRLRRVGYIVRRASDHFLVACLRSLRLKVQPVCLMTLFISNNLHCDFVSHISNAVSWARNSKSTSSLGQLVLSKFVKPGLSTVSVDN